MPDVGLRDLGSFVPGRRPKEPIPPPLPPKVAPAAAPAEDVAKPATTAAATPAVIVTPPPPPPKIQSVFAGDLATGPDALGIEPILCHLAELALHKGTTTPLCLGLFGPPGAGKSFALAALVRRVRALAAAAGGAGQSPFHARVHVQAIDAAALGDDVPTALGAKLYAGLRQAYPDLAREIALVARDPHLALREATERLDEARRRLDAERRALDEAGSRRARLTETVLYEAAGSQVDAYARANRPSLEARLVSFGITGDPVRNYKDLVQLVAGSGGKVGLALRSLWAFKGQAKLIVTAVILIAIGIGLGTAIDDQTAWLGSLRAGQQTGTAVANWFQRNMGLLATAKSAAYLVAFLCLVANLWRAFSFLQPVLKGVRLLQFDLDTRRRDLDSLVAHQTKRVDALDRDVDRLTREVAEAEQRAGTTTGKESSAGPSPFENAGGAAQAQSFFAGLSAAMRRGGNAPVPHRIVLALDHLDSLTPDKARAVLDHLCRLGVDGLVYAVALNPARLDPDGNRRADLERWVQVPLRLDAARRSGYGSFVQSLLGRSDAPVPPKLEARESALDRPIGADEATLLAALADLAGRSPRKIKRFVDLYRLARLDDEAGRGALAFMLALANDGTVAEKAAVKDAIAAGGKSAPFDVPQATARLRVALDAATTLDGRLMVDDAHRAARRTALFTIAA